MTVYHSKPHTVRAFQFTETNIKPPEWFVKACVKGEASVTINGKSRHITVHKGKDEMHKAYPYDWICCTDDDKLFVMGNKGFEKCFIVE